MTDSPSLEISHSPEFEPNFIGIGDIVEWGSGTKKNVVVGLNDSAVEVSGIVINDAGEETLAGIGGHYLDEIRKLDEESWSLERIVEATAKHWDIPTDHQSLTAFKESLEQGIKRGAIKISKT